MSNVPPIPSSLIRQLENESFPLDCTAWTAHAAWNKAKERFLTLVREHEAEQLRGGVPLGLPSGEPTAAVTPPTSSKSLFFKLGQSAFDMGDAAIRKDVEDCGESRRLETSPAIIPIQPWPDPDAAPPPSSPAPVYASGYSEKKLYVVASEKDADPEDRVWTLSLTPSETGWETDSGFKGYGLTRDFAQAIADTWNSRNQTREYSVMGRSSVNSDEANDASCDAPANLPTNLDQCEIPVINHDLRQAWGRIRDAMEYYTKVALYARRSSGEAGGIATHEEVGYLASNCAPDVKTVDAFMRGLKPVSIKDGAQAMRATRVLGVKGDAHEIMAQACAEQWGLKWK